MIWKSFLIGLIVCFIWTNSAGYLLLAGFTDPFGLIIYVTDAVIFLPLFIVAIIGMRATKESRKKASVLGVIFWSSVIF